MLFDWDTFFAATMAAIGDRDLAYADAMEILREETPQGFVPNYARPGGWKSFDRSEPPVGAITVLGLYQQVPRPLVSSGCIHTAAALEPLVGRASRHAGLPGLGQRSGQPTRQSRRHAPAAPRRAPSSNRASTTAPCMTARPTTRSRTCWRYADVGLMSMYIADCDALAQIADELDKPAEAKELNERGDRYRARLATLWSEHGRHLSQQGPAHRAVQPRGFRRPTSIRCWPTPPRRTRRKP